MQTISLYHKFKLSIGISVFAAVLLAIFSTFLLSLGLFVMTLLNYAFDIALWIGPFMFLVLLFGVIVLVSKNTNVKVVFFNAAAFFFALGAIDVSKMIWPSFDLRNSILTLINTEKKQENNSKTNEETTVNTADIKVFYEDQSNYFIKSDVLGYAPAKNRKTRTYSTYKADTLFDVNYTIDRSGLRISPPFIPHPESKSILFFGCSITFGYGLQDDESMPYLTGYKTDGKYKVYNFSFNGYGTHQMVSMLEHNYLDSIVKVSPQHIFYSAIPDHVNRNVNKKDWGAHDPKYLLSEEGEAVYAGHFDDYSSEWIRDVILKIKTNYNKIVTKSYVLQMLNVKKSNTVNYAKEDQELFLALILKARKLSKEKYPHAKFHIIYWSMQPDPLNGLLDELESQDIQVHIITDIIPDYNNFSKYWIKYPVEPHPNALANHQISDYIVREVIGEPNF